MLTEGRQIGDGELMASDELDKVELPALKQLQSLGWSYVEGAKLSPDESGERSSLKDVVLEKPPIPQEIPDARPSN